MTVDGGLRYPSDLRGVLFRILLELRSERRIARRHAVVRRALEDGQVSGSLGDYRGGLDARGAGADLPDPLAAEIDAFMRPLPGVVPASGEGLATGHIRNIGR